MRSTTVLPNPSRAAKAVRLVVVSGVIAGLTALFSCTEADNSITDPLKVSNDTEVHPGFEMAARLNVCVDPSSPPGVYKFTNSGFLSIYRLDGVIDGADGGDGVTIENVPDGQEYQIAVGACQEVMTRMSADPQHDFSNAADPLSGINVTATTIPSYAEYVHTDCHMDTPQHDNATYLVFPTPCGAENNPTRAYINVHHGVELHFIFALASEPVAMFVIGDVEPHSPFAGAAAISGKNKVRGPAPVGGDIVNFWGSQWWKNNIMSQFTSPGYPAFKGYADFSDNRCGGTWTSLPGNGSKPPKTIGDDVAIIVTSNVWKNGPNISGNIEEIVLVHQDGGYGPNPGHDGNGRVTAVLCTSDQQ